MKTRGIPSTDLVASDASWLLDEFRRSRTAGSGTRRTRLADPPDAISFLRATAAEADKPRPQRAAQQRLDEHGRTLLDRLPEQVSLHHTVRDFPGVVNRLGAVWTSPSRFEQLADELLLTDRLDREGFPFAVANELASLREFHTQWIQAQRIKR